MASSSNPRCTRPRSSRTAGPWSSSPRRACRRNPITGAINQASFSLVAPAGNTSGAGGSATVPFDTTLVFQAGSALKLQGSSLFVQDQGSALQAQGTLADPVNFTSYNDATVGGATNGNPDSQPHAGDWGGVVFRNYDDSLTAQQQKFPVDGILAGTNGAAAVSGARTRCRS